MFGILEKGSSFEFTLPAHPPSVNHTYMRSKFGKVFKNAVARDWETMAQLTIKREAHKQLQGWDLSPMRGKPIELSFTFYRPSWRAKTGKNKGGYVRPDISNFIKILEDCVCGVLCLDDSAVVALNCFKKEDMGGEVRTHVRMRFL